MPSTITFYFVQRRTKPNGFPEIIPHGKDEETGELYYKFLDNSKARKLLESQKALYPNFEYRIVKEITKFDPQNWE